HWLITGEGLMLKDQSSSVKESKMAYYISGNRSSKAIAAMLPLVSDLEERIEELKKENQNIKEQLIELEISVDELNKEKDPANPPSKKSP
ncbi:MAG: hypothetical protein ACPH28_01215, partial [Flavobacteriaceae bacterium]